MSCKGSVKWPVQELLIVISSLSVLFFINQDMSYSVMLSAEDHSFINALFQNPKGSRLKSTIFKSYSINQYVIEIVDLNTTNT